MTETPILSQDGPQGSTGSRRQRFRFPLWLRRVFIGVAILVLGNIALDTLKRLWIRFWDARERMVVLEFSGNVAGGVNERGGRLWEHSFVGTNLSGFVTNMGAEHSSKSIQAIIWVGGSDADAGKILSFDSTGRTNWEFDANKQLQWNYPGVGSGALAVHSCQTARLFAQNERQIVAVFKDIGGSFPSVLSIIGHDGKNIASYWHPGTLGIIKIGTFRPSTLPRILVQAINNAPPSESTKGIYVRTVFLLDPTFMLPFGEAPPRFGKLRDGSEEWYGRVLPPNTTVEDVAIIESKAGVGRVMVKTPTNEIFYISHSGKIIQVTRGQGAVGSNSFEFVQ